jgi:hypothetical protein
VYRAACNPNASAAKNAKAAKKNIWKLTAPRPDRLIAVVTSSLRTAALTSKTHRLPTVADRFQKAMMALFIVAGAWL